MDILLGTRDIQAHNVEIQFRFLSKRPHLIIWRGRSSAEKRAEDDPIDPSPAWSKRRHGNPPSPKEA
jgi:hypothetical protein